MLNESKYSMPWARCAFGNVFNDEMVQVELEDWKTKTNKITAELNELKAQYKELEKKVALSLL